MKTVYETLPPTLQRRHNEMVRDKVAETLWQSPTIQFDNKSPLRITSTGGIVGGYPNQMTGNVPLYWGCEGRLAMFKKCQNKIVIDIGVNANGACVTFDDSSMLEIKPANDMANLIEKTSLNFLNGTLLDDIVVVPHFSLVSDWVGNLLLCGENGAQVIFKIISPTSSTNFVFDLKELNAIR